MAVEVGTDCAPDSAAFAARLARWQAQQGLAPDGRMTPAVFETMKGLWQGRRSFLALRAQGICPDPPEAGALAPVPAGDRAGDRPVLLAPQALRAFQGMRAAARRDLGIDGADESLAVFSGYRSPATTTSVVS